MTDFLVFVVILSGLILGHELGHFFAARLAGVEIEELGIGFPPRIATVFENAGTKYTLNLLPFGGFVRPKGENDPSIPGGLAGASKRARAGVLLGGPLANLVLAFFAFSAAFQFAAPDPARVMITEVSSNSPAQAAGLQAGDIILAVQSVPVDGFSTLQGVVAERLGEPTRLTIARGDEMLDFTVTPRIDAPEDQGAIGILLGHPRLQVGLGQSMQMGLSATAGQFVELLRLPARLVQGDIAPEQARVSGFKGMYDMLAWAGEIDRSSNRPFLTLSLIGVISSGLAIANLLPIPALDGGRLLFVVFELITRKRIAPEKEGLAHLIGFAFLLMLMVYINLQDFINPISLPR